MLKQRRGKPFAETAPAPALVPPEQSCCVCGHVVLECKEMRPMAVWEATGRLVKYKMYSKT